jgi:hypothetical protein
MRAQGQHACKLQVSYENEAEELELESSAEYKAALQTAGVPGYHLGAQRPPTQRAAGSARCPSSRR